MDKESKKKNMVLIIVFGILLIAIIFSASYAYFRVNTSSNGTLSNISGTLECLDITYSEENVINLSNQYPMADEYALNNLTPLTVTVTNNCSANIEAVNYVLTYTSLSENTGYIPDNKMKVAVRRKIDTNTEKTAILPSYVSDLETLTSGTTYTMLTNDLANRQNVSTYTNKTNYVLDRNTVAAGTTNIYKVYMWIDYYEGDTTHEGLNNNSTQNKDYKSTLSVVLNSEEMPTNKVEVTFDSNGGTLNSIYTSKDVYVGEEYGELPTPTREGYTFLGWNGKNLLNSKDLSFYAKNVGIVVDENENVSDTSPSGDSRTWGYAQSNWHVRLNPGVYTVSLYFLTQSTQGNNISGIYTEGDEERLANISLMGKDTVTYTFTFSEEKNIGIMPKGYDGVYKIQLEAGTESTEWEPYYITNDTSVVQEQNHTLKAIWEKEKASLIINPNGGVYWW